MSALTLSHISLTIGDHQILRDVSFSVAEGQVIGLIGPNGSGKTTLFNVLSGFVVPSAGSIELRGRDITRLAPHRRALLGLGRVFQNFGIFREMTLEDNVLVAIEALPKSARRNLGDLKKLVHDTLASIGLHAHAQSKASSLSGGQMRLLEIGRTLASGKEIFLLDEPTAGVSPKMTAQVAELIRGLKKQGKTVLVIEHDLPFISSICDEVIVLDVGEVVLRGAPAAIKQEKKLQDIYFGADPTS